MATALDLISQAMRRLGVYQIGEAVSSDEAASGLVSLNQIMDSLANEDLIVYAKTLDTIPLVSNQAVYTIGASGSFTTTRPIKILDECTITYNNVITPINSISLTDFNKIMFPNVTGIPYCFFALNNLPDISITVYPIPLYPMTLKLWSNKQIQSFTNLTDVVNLPAGYEQFLVNLLAEHISPEYGVVPNPVILKQISYSRKLLKKTNRTIPYLDMPNRMGVRTQYNING